MYEYVEIFDYFTAFMINVVIDTIRPVFFLAGVPFNVLNIYEYLVANELNTRCGVNYHKSVYLSNIFKVRLAEG